MRLVEPGHHTIGRLALAVALAGAAAGCATGSGPSGGVGARLIAEPPYYAGRSPGRPGEAMAHLPIAYQRGAMQERFFDPADGPGSEIGGLLREMNAYLDSMGVSTRVVVQAGARARPPAVEFGCEQTPLGECAAESREISVQGKPWMRLSASRPSADWVAGARAVLESAGAGHVLVISLEVGQYWTHQRNLLGEKEVRLGSDHFVRLPWLTSLTQPVQVLQLTGALVDREGRPARVGAEGLVARQTHLILSSLGAQELIGREDVARLRSARRSDLPGEPLVWEVALRHLVAGLIGRPELALR